MFPPAFDYRRAGSVEEALDLLASRADAELLAGGHGLLPAMKTGRASPGLLVDVGDLDLAGIDPGDPTVVGALATHADLADADGSWERAPVLAEAAAHVGDRQVRNRGTVGGNLAEADPAADLPAATVAADAALVVRGRDGEREVPAGAFFEGDGDTALDDAELVTEVRVPAAAGGAYARKTHPASGFALVGVAAVVATEGGTVTAARVAATGVTDRPVRLGPVESALVGESATTTAVAAAAERAADDLDASRLRSDAQVSGEYRAALLSTYAERALASALDRAAGSGEVSRHG